MSDLERLIWLAMEYGAKTPDEICAFVQIRSSFNCADVMRETKRTLEALDNEMDISR